MKLCVIKLIGLCAGSLTDLSKSMDTIDGMNKVNEANEEMYSECEKDHKDCKERIKYHLKEWLRNIVGLQRLSEYLGTICRPHPIL